MDIAAQKATVQLEFTVTLYLLPAPEDTKNYLPLIEQPITLGNAVYLNFRFVSIGKGYLHYQFKILNIGIFLEFISRIHRPDPPYLICQIPPVPRL